MIEIGTLKKWFQGEIPEQDKYIVLEHSCKNCGANEFEIVSGGYKCSYCKTVRLTIVKKDEMMTTDQIRDSLRLAGFESGCLLPDKKARKSDAMGMMKLDMDRISKLSASEKIKGYKNNWEGFWIYVDEETESMSKNERLLI